MSDPALAAAPVPYLILVIITMMEFPYNSK